MAPSKLDLTGDLGIYQGDDYALDVTITAAGSPVNLTGHTFQAELRAGPADTATTVLATFTCTITNPAAGELRLELPKTVTVTLTTPNAVWDLEHTSPAGWVTTYLAGKVTITPEVTR